MTADEAVDQTEDVEATEHLNELRPRRFQRITGRLKKLSPRKTSRWSGKIAAGVLAASVVLSLGVFGWLFWFRYQPDRETDAAAAKSAIAAASDGAVAVLSYSPDTLDRDFATAKSHLTGDFLSYYEQFTQQIVGPAAKTKALKTSAVVLRAALTEFRPDSAVVLLFINQSTQSKDRPEPSMTSSSVLVTLTKADGRWLISQFNVT